MIQNTEIIIKNYYYIMINIVSNALSKGLNATFVLSNINTL